ncbi:MAG: fumarylacetoacetate hydrolase family protein [Thermoleophilia bacterium]|nr:fumarylacetoacetate hydrolase family protein [Thermoleophilia bacterium]
MKLVQFYTPELGPRLGSVQDDGKVFDLSAAQPSYASFNALLEWSGGNAAELEKLARQAEARVPDEIEFIYDWLELDRAPSATLPHLMIPLSPPEVWGFGVTYQRSAEVRDADVAATMDSSASIYDRVYHAERPECFFKATAPRCVGPHRPIGIRSDSELTATEPELAYVLGTNRQIVGYTICNDVSAWDLERDNPLYLPQSKIFTGCCALGPAIVTASGGPDPYSLDIECRIVRAGEVIFHEGTNSGRIGRRFEELNECLYRDNPIPPGTVVSTGTGIMVPNEFALRDGDVVEIEIEGIGILSNPAARLS